MKIITETGVAIEVRQIEDGKILWNSEKVSTIQLTNEEAHKLAIALLGGSD